VTGTIAADPDGAGPLGAPAVRNSYDVAGRLIRVEQGALAAWQPDTVAPANWPGFTVHKIVDTSYDALDRKAREAVSGGGVTASVTEYGYDLAGRLTCTAVRMNPDVWATPLADKCVPGPASATYGADRISRSVYDPNGRLAQSKEGVGTALERTEATYTYNANGQKLSLVDSRGYRAEMSYDGFGRQRRWTFPSKTATGTVDPNDYEEYGYDAAGNRTSLRKRDGSVLTFQYDAANRVTAKLVPERSDLDPSHTRDVYYAYDNRGLQTEARFLALSGEGVSTRYDGFGRVISSTTAMSGMSWTIGHSYDRDGNRIRIDHPDGHFFNYDYDPLGRLVQLREDGAAVLSSFTYDQAGRDLGQAYNAGATATSYGYDAAGRLTSLTHNLAGTSGDQTIGLSYNPASQIVGRTGTNDSYAWTGAYAANRNYAVNGQNQYTAAGPAAFTYDLNGNLVSDGLTSFIYDDENRLVWASGAKNAGLLYDPLGRLFQTWAGPAGASGLVRFLYDDDALIAEYDVNGTLLRRYMHGGDKGADDPLIWWDNATAGWRRGLVADQQGSIVAVTDVYGQPVAINTYDEYGIPGAGNQGRFQYTGQAWIPELGMYYYKSRMYSPTLGRFMQIDTIGYEGGINLYAYVDDDPVNRADPKGTEGIAAVVGAGIGTLVGLGTQAVDDFATGHFSGADSYASAAFGGAAGGFVAGMTGNVKAGMATAGFVQEGSKALIRGEGVSMAMRKGLVGAGANLIAGKIGGRLAPNGKGLVGQLIRRTGIGRNAAANERFANMMRGRMAAGGVRNLGPRTLARMAAASATSGAVSDRAAGMMAGSINQRQNPSCGVGERCGH